MDSLTDQISSTLGLMERPCLQEADTREPTHLHEDATTAEQTIFQETSTIFSPREFGFLIGTARAEG